ncbi:hypothetical protein IGI04_042649 [Brassica rapa subsp. trilocularis]|uniref:Uncharacterized protein n=1 Tax=Brassica rapa subsp. trilocularis TaxID=1813537 RepID=A0ABQ7KIV8_BRACM|nr:hypothetical protein IGI04_042649 [Brassica rapa subsp. trilocularis]
MSVNGRQHTQDVCGCPSAHTGRPWLSVCVRQHTQDVRGCLCVSVSTHRTSVAVRVCPCVSISTHMTSVAVHQYTYQHVGPWTQHVDPSRGLFGCVRVCPCVSVSTHKMSVAVHQYTYQHVGPSTQLAEPPWAVCSVHRGRSWVSAITHRRSVAVCQHTQDVHGCPCVSVSTHRTSVAVHQTSVAIRVCPCVSVSTHRMSVAVHEYTYQHAGPWTQHAGPSRELFGTDRTYVAVRMCPFVSLCVRQHTQDVRGCPCVSVFVCVCPSAHTGRLWQSISTHISTLVLGLSTLTLPVDCSGVSVCVRQHTQDYTEDVRGCPPSHTGSPWLSVSTHRTSMAVRVCPSAHTGRLWLSISTYISTLVLGLSTLALPADCSGDFGPRGMSVQYTQDVCGCPPAHTGRLWLSVAVRLYTQDVRGYLCLSVCIRQHTQDSVCTHRTSVAIRVCSLAHTGRLWLTLLVDCSGDFGPRGLSVQYTQDVCGFLPAHTGRPGLSVCVRQHTHDVCGYPSVHISARWSLDSTRWPFPWTVRVILAHVGSLFSTHRTSVVVRQHTHDVCGCPSAHTGPHTGRPWQSISTHISTLVLGLSTLTLPVDSSGVSVCVRQHTLDVRGCPSYTEDVRGCPPSHTGGPWLSVSTHRTSMAVRVCPSAHTGRLWLSISTNISTLVLGLSTLALPVDCSGDFGPRGMSVQYTQDVCGCPPAHTGCLWLSVAVRLYTQDVRGYPCLSVCVHQDTQDVCGCPSVHISTRWSLDSARWAFPWTVRVILAHVGCLFSTHRTTVGVCQHTQDVRGCLWLSVCTHKTSVAIRVCPCVSVSTHRTSVAVHEYTYNTLVLGLSTLGLPVDCSGDFGPCGLTSVAIRVCPCVSVSTHRTSVAVHEYTYQLAGPWTQQAGPSCGQFGMSVGVSQHRQDVCGCPYVSVCVRVCSPAHTGRVWLSISTHMSTLVLGLSTLTLPVDCSGDFGPRGLSVQYTQDVCGCLPAQTGRPGLSVAVRHHTKDIRASPCVSVCVRQHTQDVCGCPSVHISARLPLDSAR